MNPILLMVNCIGLNSVERARPRLLSTINLWNYGIMRNYYEISYSLLMLFTHWKVKTDMIN